MDLREFKKNIRIANSYAASMKDKFKFLLLLYSNNKSFKKIIGSRTFKISFSFPSPLNKIILDIRNNNGSDSFIFSEIFLHKYYYVELNPKPLTILDLGA